MKNDQNEVLTKSQGLSLPRPQGWPLERVLHLMAGTVVLTSVVLAYLFSPLWLILTGFVGVSLLLDASVGWCPSSILLYRLDIRTSAECALRTASKK